jgi:L-asparaginase
MVSNGYRKRGVGCMLLRKVKNPIKLAKEMLVRGEELDGGGAGGHCQLSGDELEALAETWSLDLVEPEYFWTKERWDQHKKGLEREREHLSSGSRMSAVERSGEGDPSWDSNDYVPQGTVGAVVIDSSGTIAVATSTGGLTNKLSGRIGDTPTLGAGFWAEEWTEENPAPSMIPRPPTQSLGFLNNLSRGNIAHLIGKCFPTSGGGEESFPTSKETRPTRHAVGLSGTGNGDSFLKIAAVRSSAAICRFSTPNRPLSEAITRIAGPGGELQRSAGDRWGKSGEGEGGIIGIELVGDKTHLALDFNRGMFRAYVDDNGQAVFGAFRAGD